MNYIKTQSARERVCQTYEPNELFYSLLPSLATTTKRIENKIKMNVCILMCMCQYFIQIFGYFFLFLSCQGKKKMYGCIHSFELVSLKCCALCGSKWVMLCLVSLKEVERLFLKFMSLKNMGNIVFFWKLWMPHIYQIYAPIARLFIRCFSACLTLSGTLSYTQFHVIPINRKIISIGCTISTNNRIPD